MSQTQPPATAKQTHFWQPAEATPSNHPDESLSVRSLDRAESAFRAFSLSRFPKGAKPAHYVDGADAPTAHALHREVITQQLNRLSAKDVHNPGLTVALPRSAVAKLLPSLDEGAATLALDDVLRVVGQYLRGTELYADGNPVLNRLALQARAQELVAAVAQLAIPQPQEHKSALDLLRRWRSPQAHKANAGPRELG